METALVARQPVFDLQGRIWGYELLFRPAPERKNATASPTAATSTVMLDGFELIRPMLRGNQRLLINYTEELLSAEAPSMLPPEICAVEILESVKPTESVLSSLLSLKKKGFLLVLDDYMGQRELTPFLRLADVIKVDVLSSGLERTQKLANILRPRLSALLLAEKVEDQYTADICRTWGFTLFQGFFYSKPEIVKGKKLSPGQATMAQLLAHASGGDADLERMKELIASNIYLSYRLLKYINSAFFGMSVAVQNVDRAVTMLGLQNVRNWLFVVAMAGMNDSPKAQEIALLAAFRAKFLQNLGEKQNNGRDRAAFNSDLFACGLFSLLESLLQMPLDDIFESLPIKENVREVLTRGTGPLAPWYNLMLSYDAGEWAQVQNLSAQLALNGPDMASAYADAGKWSKDIFDLASTG